MASITSDSKVTRSPSAATASKPPGGSPQTGRGAAPSAPASAARGFDPSSSFFPQALPGIDAPTASPQRVQSWRKWLWPLGGLLLVGGGSLYYVQQQAQDRSVPDARSTRIPANNAAPSANAARPDGNVGRQGPQPTSQARITHTLPAGAPPAGAPPAKIPSIRATQDTRPVVAPADNPAAELPAMDHTLPRVTHTRQ